VKKKRKSINALREEAARVFNRWVRMRDCFLATGSIHYGECISCGEPFPFEKLEAGHFVPKHNNNYFSEDGVHAQCKKCNRFLSGNQLGYRRSLVVLYGEKRTSELEFENVPFKKFTREELENLKNYYKEKIKELK